MLLFFGLLLFALGLLSGAALLLAALGVLVTGAGGTLWVTFPLLSLLGFAQVAAHAEAGLTRMIALLASALLLVLALASMGALVLGSAGLIPSPPHTSPLWYVFVVAGVMGSLGAASYSRQERL